MTRLISLVLVLMLPALAQAQAGQNQPLKVPDNVEMKKDIVYARGGERDLKLDLFLPKGGEGARPGIVFIHGGGWQGGNRGQFHRQAAYLASKGYVGACIEYRLSGEAKFPAAVEDCKAAVRWLRAGTRDLRVDPDRIAVAGGSAGGHLAALLGTTAGMKDLEGQGGHAEQSSRVHLVVAFNGVFDLEAAGKSGRASTTIEKFLGAAFSAKPELYRKASPMAHVDRSDPPFLFLHAADDTTVPIAQSKDMKKKLEEVGVKGELYEVDKGGHGFFNRAPHFEPALQRMEAFLNEHLKPRSGTKP